MPEKKKKKIYSEICEKLGFEPYKVQEEEGDHEDDNWINPFASLSFEEIDFLYDNGLFTKGLA